jgi:hypothetical protein
MKKRIFLYAGVPLLVLFAAFGAWYVYAELSGRSGINMNHAFHENVGVGCDFCHQVSGKDPRFVSFPNHENCSACHAEAIAETSPDKNCELCHSLPGYQTRVRKDRVLSPLVRFDHNKHSAKEVGCDACHPVLDQAFLTADEMLPKMEPTCIECHDRRQVADVKDCSTCHLEGWQKIAPLDHQSPSYLAVHDQDLTSKQVQTICNECHTAKLDNSCTECHHQKGSRAAKTKNCAVCHGTGFENRRPKDHSPQWTVSHGKNLTQSRIDSSCNLCHTAAKGNDCLACHRREAPKNHNTAWTALGHGRKARLNRESCATCHDQSECTSCHTTQEPISHTGLWGSPRNRHCINCHMESGNYASGAVGSNCSFCHQSADVYAAHVDPAFVRPPGHPVDSCTNCHRISGSIPNTNIPHPYPTSAVSCRSCHL